MVYLRSSTTPYHIFPGFDAGLPAVQLRYRAEDGEMLMVAYTCIFLQSHQYKMLAHPGKPAGPEWKWSHDPLLRVYFVQASYGIGR